MSSCYAVDNVFRWLLVCCFAVSWEFLGCSSCSVVSWLIGVVVRVLLCGCYNVRFVARVALGLMCFKYVVIQLLDCSG